GLQGRQRKGRGHNAVADTVLHEQVPPVSLLADRERDLAEALASVEPRERRRKILEREGGVDDRPPLRFRDVRNESTELPRAAHRRADDATPAPEERKRVDLCGGPRRGPKGDEHATRAKCFQ